MAFFLVFHEPLLPTLLVVWYIDDVVALAATGIECLSIFLAGARMDTDVCHAALLHFFQTKTCLAVAHCG